MRSRSSANTAEPWYRLGVGSILLGLLRNPVGLTLLLSLTILALLPLSDPPAELALVVCSCVTAVGIAVYWDVFSLPARIRRVTGQLGLVHRTPRGRVQRLRCCSWRQVTRHHARLTWRLPPGVTLSDVLDRQEAIEQATDSEVVCWVEHRRLVMEVLRAPIPDCVPFTSFYAASAPPGQLVIGLGRSHRGRLWVDLATLPHLLVGGMTGGGKSVFITQALTHLVLTRHPDELRLLCVDLKGGVELDAFAQTPHSLEAVVTSVEEAARALGSVRDEVDSRLRALRNASVRDVDAWADTGRPPWPRILAVVDELAELTVRELGAAPAALAAQKAATGRLAEIARLGRAVGIHLILCTQRPDAEAVPGQLKANLAGTVAFRVRSEVNSHILLESDRAALLPHHPGRAIWAHERLEEFQAIHLAAAAASRFLADRARELSGGGPVVVTPGPLDTSLNSGSIWGGSEFPGIETVPRWSLNTGETEGAP
jgi:DNA segregation ATPase FtsK/SpoIIIE-like protein